MEMVEQEAVIARYSCPMWRGHFLNVPWFQALEDAACAELSGRVFDPREYIPESSLRSIRCVFRPLTDAEVATNGRYWSKRTHTCLEFLLEEADFDTLRSLYESQAIQDDLSIDDFVSYSASSELENFCDMILFLLNIAYCGALKIDSKSVWFGDHETTSYHMAILSLPGTDYDYEFLTEGVFPEISLDEILAWSLGCNGIWHGNAVTPLEKAMSFLSHSFHADYGGDGMPTLLWATAGLEAVACDSSNSVSAQLKRRLPLICNLMPFTDVAKSVTEAYNFRSRLFHGDISMVNSFNPDEVDWSEDRYDSKMSKFGLMLQLMLISIIWRAVKEGANALTFAEVAEFRSAEQ